jgi:hypothetical protein
LDFYNPLQSCVDDATVRAIADVNARLVAVQEPS